MDDRGPQLRPEFARLVGFQQCESVFEGLSECRRNGYREQRVRFAGVEEPEDIVISRVETVRSAYGARFERHRAGLAEIARAVGWTLGYHRTDRPPHLALLALHAALAADRRL